MQSTMTSSETISKALPSPFSRGLGRALTASPPPRTRSLMTSNKVLLPPSKSAGKLSYHRRAYSSFQFPWRLHEMLDNEAGIEGFSSIVSWLPDGNSFKVHDQKAFVSQIMPLYFKQTQYKSFLRQLNIWCFERITKGIGQGGYRHESLVRSKPSLCSCMKRIKNKGTRDSRRRMKPLESSHETIVSDKLLFEQHVVDYHVETDPFEPSSCFPLVSFGSKPQNADNDVRHEGHPKENTLGWSESRQFYQIFHEQDFRGSPLEPQDRKYILIGQEMGRKLTEGRNSMS
jgi:hypothetical protein